MLTIGRTSAFLGPTRPAAGATMGTMSFLLPAGAPAEASAGLRRACLCGGHERFPVPTRVLLAHNKLTLTRDADESGFAVVPYPVSGHGFFSLPTASLMERSEPYALVLELARGKLNQLRNQYSDWQMAGLRATAEVEGAVRDATRAFGSAVLDADAPASAASARAALAQAVGAGDVLINAYVDQVFALRHQRLPRLDTSFGCRVANVPAVGIDEAYRLSFNAVRLPLEWAAVEAGESQFDWGPADAVADWALGRNLAVHSAPLIDFGPGGAPAWLKPWLGEFPALASFMCEYVEQAVKHFKGRVKRWHIGRGSNCLNALKLGEEDMFRLTARVAEAVLNADPQAEVYAGVSQPWGEYLSGDDFTYSPFVFADTLLRAGIPLAGYDVEWAFGSAPRGNICRDLLEASRLLDLYGMLGVPIQLTLAYPSSAAADAKASPNERAGESGAWRDLTPDGQASFAEAFGASGCARTM